MNKIVIRGSMMLCWLGILLGFLYSPYLYNLLSKDRTLSVYCWSDMIAPEAIADFEHKTGIKVYLSYYENNEELLTKLELNKGQSYDIVMPSDYVVRRFISKNLLQPIDHSRLSFLSELDSRLLGHWYDPENRYSLPYFWYLYGIGTHQHLAPVVDANPSWSLLYDKNYLQGSIGLTDDPHEIIATAAHYLFGTTAQLTHAQREKLLQLLIELKPHIALFSDVQGSFLLTSGACAMLLTTSYVIGKARQQGVPVYFKEPEDGTFILIDNIVIPASCTKIDLVYQLINHLYDYHVMNMTVENQCYCASRQDILQQQNLEFVGGYANLDRLTQRNRLLFMQDMMTKQQLNAFWLALKSA